MIRIARKLASLRRSEDGGIAVLTALSLPVLILLVGGALDYSNATRNQYRLQTITDAALLATLSHRRQNTEPLSSGELLQIFEDELKKRFKQRFDPKLAKLGDIKIKTGDKGAVSAVVEARVSNMFLRMIGLREYKLGARADAQSSTSRTEVALVLDITGSMAGSKLRELKTAVAQFLNTIDNKMRNAPAENFKVAVVPFSKYVNVGLDKRDEPWISVYKDGWRGKGWNKLYVQWEGCVGSRDHPFNTSDDNYLANPVPGVMNYRRDPRYSASTRDGWWDNPWWGGTGVQRCQPNVIMPLRSVKLFKKQIIDRVDSFKAGGWTYIPAGLAWGWRVLSPGAPYTEGANDYEVKRFNVQKVIVLMTDGANTVAPYRYWKYAYHDHGSASSAYANEITKELCDNIKAINPATGKRNAEIITITFDVRSPDIKKLMKECASLASFDVKKGNLAQIFDEIAEKLVDLHLSF